MNTLASLASAELALIKKHERVVATFYRHQLTWIGLGDENDPTTYRWSLRADARPDVGGVPPCSSKHPLAYYHGNTVLRRCRILFSTPDGKNHFLALHGRKNAIYYAWAPVARVKTSVKRLKEVPVGSRVFCEKADGHFWACRVVKKCGDRRYVVKYPTMSPAVEDMALMLVRSGKR